MGYYLEQCDFTIPNSKEHYFDLIMEREARCMAVCFQVHRMTDETAMAFWNFAPESSDLIRIYNKFVTDNDLPKDIRITDILAHPLFPEALHQCYPIAKTVLTHNQHELVKALHNKGLPQDVDKPHGLDGGSYTLRLYGINPREYRCWIVLPKEWGLLQACIDLLIDCAQLDRRLYALQ